MTEISEFGVILIFIIGAIVFFMVALLTARLLRPDRPNIEKLTTYESGEEPVGSAWGKFTIRFYVVALVFILFEVELVFLFPWAVVLGDKTLNADTHGLWGWFTLLEMAIFIGILALGLAYVWVKGHLDWVKPEATIPVFDSPVPATLYQKVNEKYSRTEGKTKS